MKLIFCYVAKWINKTCSQPFVVFGKPLQSKKTRVQCGVCSQGILGPYLFKDERGNTTIISSEHYVEMLCTFLPSEVTRFNLNQDCWFQQEAVTSHTAHICMAVRRNLFSARLISRLGDVAFPARSPDFFIWRHLKSVVYRNWPANLIQLETRH